LAEDKEKAENKKLEKKNKLEKEIQEIKKLNVEPIFEEIANNILEAWITFDKEHNIDKFGHKRYIHESDIIKDNVKSNYIDNLNQYVKTGGLIIVNNMAQLDQSFIAQIINIINEAKTNKYIDKSLRLIFTLSEPFINDDINDMLLKNCVYFNIDLYNDIQNINFKNKILENIKEITNDIVSFFSITIIRKKI
jgi:oligoribonuclease (3'-5' exoribonuclease)